MLRLIPLLLLCILSLLSPALAAPPPPQPNIVFILIDDMGWRDLACTGSTFYETPNIDRIAHQGLLFTSAYAACPVCSPSRASILTGQYPARVGLTDYLNGKSAGRLLPAPYLHHLPLQLPNTAKSLHSIGYQTWHVGKWHLGPEPFWPEHQGFNVNIGGFDAGHPSSYFSPYKNPRLPDGPPGEFLTDRLTDEAIKLIKNRDPNHPFYLNLCQYAVHTPIQAPAPLIQKYKLKAHTLGLDQKNPLVRGEHFPILSKPNQRVTRRTFQSDPTYAALIENLDTNIGHLLQTLDDLHLSNNTLVIFTSDNGGLSTAEGSPTSNNPLLDGKGWLYEGALRVPLLIRWPGVITPASTNPTPVIDTDFYPTFLDIAHLPLSPTPDQHIDGLSLLPLLTHSADLPPRDLFWHYPHYGNQGGTPGSVIRSGPWKLVEFFDPPHLELYNLTTTPDESHDVSAAHPDIVSSLHQKLIAWRADVHAKFPTTNPAYPHPAATP